MHGSAARSRASWRRPSRALARPAIRALEEVRPCGHCPRAGAPAVPRVCQGQAQRGSHRQCDPAKNGQSHEGMVGCVAGVSGLAGCANARRGAGMADQAADQAGGRVPTRRLGRSGGAHPGAVAATAARPDGGGRQQGRRIGRHRHRRGGAVGARWLHLRGGVRHPRRQPEPDAGAAVRHAQRPERGGAHRHRCDGAGRACRRTRTRRWPTWWPPPRAARRSATAASAQAASATWR